MHTVNKIKKHKNNTLQEIEEIKRDFELLHEGLVTEDSLLKSTKTIKDTHIFANTEVHLREISVFGFDYDYTIANYSKKTLKMTYGEAKKYLVLAMHYPKEILDFEYDQNFAIRGLHYDTKSGLLFKLDQFSRIESDSVYRGKTKVAAEEVESLFPGCRIGDDYALQHLKMMSDLFEIPLAGLLADTIDFFMDKKIGFNNAYIYFDIRKAFESIHNNKTIHTTINRSLTEYIKPSKRLVSLIRKLLHSNKKLFMLTNNTFKFVHFGCAKIFEEIVNDKSFGFNDWTEIFDVVIMKAMKPEWYDSNKTFRLFDKKTNSLSVKSVLSFEKGNVYYGGSFKEFQRITQYPMSKVIYMGDNIYNDLRKPRKFCKWRTVAIIRELEVEIERANSREYRLSSLKFYNAQKLFARIRSLKDKNKGHKLSELAETVRKLKSLITKENNKKKNVLNSHFGSTFRGNNYASKFFYNVQRYADLYTSSVDNFDDVPLNSAFYVITRPFAHEADII